VRVRARYAPRHPHDEEAPMADDRSVVRLAGEGPTTPAIGVDSSTAAGARPGSAVRISIEPARVRIDEKVRVRVVGLDPNETVVLRARTGDEWSSHATFQADAIGAVDVRSAPALSGTYHGIDQMGLFWSMVARDELTAASFIFETPLTPTTTTLTAEVGGQVVASGSLERTHVAPGVRVIPVREQGLVGTLFRPGGDGRRPAVIDLGGSIGGLLERRAALLASHGYVALALAYFGIEGLPQDLFRIPLEYFETAIGWLQAQEGVASDSVAVVGESRGGELALLLGATFPQIRAVVGLVPSSVTLVGFRRHRVKMVGVVEMVVRRPPGWTYRGAPLPTLAPGRLSFSSIVGYGWKSLRRAPIAAAPFFLEAMKDEEALERAAIPVERINGPVLLLSGEDDQFFPSALSSEAARERLARHKHPYPYEHVSYAGAGHVFGMMLPYLPSTITKGHHPASGDTYVVGGNSRDNAFAAADSWARILRFLGESLGP
jgi:dienelactone hydrolase